MERKSFLGDTRIFLTISIALFLLIVLFFYFKILRINGGTFSYALDDPYIHLALAENIARGHYGINSNEYSAPSSSILWPFLLAPFSSSQLSPLLFNILFSIVFIYFFYQYLNYLFPFKEELFSLFKGIILILSIFCFNLVGLVFVGMEHPLQVAAAFMTFFGFYLYYFHGKLRWWFLLAAFLGPLVRYENLAVTLPVMAISYFIAKGRRERIAIVGTTLVTFGFIGAFSLFLKSLGLTFFPASLLVKKQHLFLKMSKIYNVVEGLFVRQGAMLGVILFYLLIHFLFDKKYRLFYLAGILSIALHLLFGSIGHFHRYEIYILVIGVSYFLFSISSWVIRILRDRNTFLQLTFLAGLLVFIISANYLYFLVKIPLASNNIYEQHHQMHRFITKYWKGDVAANDIGRISYQNPHYVLDLFGLSSIKALKKRLISSESQWVDKLVKKYNISLALIYEQWFIIPKSWVKVAELYLGKSRVTPAYSRVDFFVTDERELSRAIRLLREFKKTLPLGVKLDIKGAH